MTPQELLDLFQANSKRAVMIGSADHGCILGLDLEGRIYYIHNGKIASRVNKAAIEGITDRSGYVNPGGDGLWPAPEGTCFGYEYATGAWRVPPGLTGAKFKVLSQTAQSVEIEAEVDLVNASQQGVPCIFRRAVSVAEENGKTVVTQKESIEYIGAKPLTADLALIAPWSLCQFDTPEGTIARFPDAGGLRDFYGESSAFRSVENGVCKMLNTKKQRWQVALNKNYSWIELELPEQNLKIRRTADALPSGQNYVDIADAPVDRKPDGDPVRFSVYSDPSGFMEIEAAGGCKYPLTAGTVLSVTIHTEIGAIK